ncbi:MAG: diaminopimelate decarboxylase [Thermodesulfobacteriota bacterium]|nr:MAG: diaminopimelate decarboxylase [Thermodesulfobacteriota bacterium]
MVLYYIVVSSGNSMRDLIESKIDQLTQQYGSPLFIASADKIKNNLEVFNSAFSQKYPITAVAYSYKVNYLPEVLKVIHNQGAWAEVASGFEYEVARKLEVPGNLIVFNGPFKTKDQLEKAIDEGAIINVDHSDEIEQLEQIASELGKKINIGIRLNMEVGIDQLPDRFGFNLESGEARQIVARCCKKGLLKITGLHVHLTSYIVQTESEDNIPAKGIKLIWPKGHDSYRKASQKLVDFSNDIRDEFDLKMEYLDMGGGFPTVNGISPYVNAIVYPILDGFKECDLPKLILEPGRAIVSDAADLITTVVAVKQLPNGQRAVVVDAGINLLPTSFWKFQDIECLKKTDNNIEETIVYGPLCLQTDIISKTKLPKLNAGDHLIVKNVGAYNIPQSSTFIYAQPAVILVNGENIKVIKKREDIKDMF